MDLDTRPLLTVRDVANRMRISDWTIREWLREGRIKGIRPGGTKAGWRVSESEFARFIASASEPSGKAS